MPELPPLCTRHVARWREPPSSVWASGAGCPMPSNRSASAGSVRPAPLMPWTGVREAVEHGPIPLQGKTFVGGGRDDPKVRDEACLTLTGGRPTPRRRCR